MKRNPLELFEDYQQRRKIENEAIKAKLKPTLIHNSRPNPGKKGVSFKNPPKE